MQIQSQNQIKIDTKAKVLETRIITAISHKISPFSEMGNKFLIASTEDGIILGEMRSFNPIQLYRFYGQWQQPTNSKYKDMQFKFVAYEPIIQNTISGLVDYLSSNVPHVGPVTAKAIVETFGRQTLDILVENPERVKEVSGLGAKLMEKVSKEVIQYFTDNVDVYHAKAIASLNELFDGTRVSQRVINSLLRGLGYDAIQYIKEKPYDLMNFPGISWLTSDKVALTKCGYSRDGIERQIAAISESLERLAQSGHTVANRLAIEQMSFSFLGYIPTQEAWDIAIEKNRIVKVTDDKASIHALSKYDRYEKEVAHRLVEILNNAEPFPFELSTDGLFDEQIKAIKLVQDNGVCIISGSPGVGKSYVVTKIITDLLNNGIKKILVSAPTGKASKRATELLQHHLPGTNIECSTVHKTLGVKGMSGDEGIAQADSRVNRGRDEFGFEHNAENKLDVEVFVIDEMSMEDIEMFCAALRAIPLGCHLILVGDYFQLPSVGPGSVLRDCISGNMPHIILSQVRRHVGRIVRACHAIKDGRDPIPCDDGKFDYLAGENWAHTEVSGQDEIASTIVDIYKSCLVQKRKMPDHPFWSKHDVMWDVQVITPQNEKIPVSCEHINALLSPILNQGDPKLDKEWSSKLGFRIGDKIIRTKNGVCIEIFKDGIEDEVDGMSPFVDDDGNYYSCARGYIVNGDMGQVKGIGKYKNSYVVIVKFVLPDRLCILPVNDHKLMQAYAITAHKSQGSGYPYVIIPVDKDFYFDKRSNQGLFTREWLYSSLSRSEDIARTVGQYDAIKMAVGRRTIDVRKTMLSEYIKMEMSKCV